MHTFKIAIVLAAVAAINAPPGPAVAAASPPEWRMSETCFGSGEKTEGMNKICYYSCPSGGAAITIPATSLCPLSIKR